MTMYEFKPKSILLTGGAGFLGSHVCNYFTTNYPNVNIVCLDILDYCSNMKNLGPSMNCSNFTFIKGNVLNIELVSLVMQIHSIDTVFHFAAQSHVDRSFGNSLDFTQTNILGTHTLLECAKKYHIKRFIHVSTDEVNGEINDRCDTDIVIKSPTNPYACSKASAEFICQAYMKSFNIPIIIARVSNTFGSMQFPEKVIPKFIYLLNENRKCTIHGEGNCLRHYLHISDVVKAFVAILHNGKIHEIYNIGTDFKISINNLAENLVKIMKGEDEKPENWIEHVDDRAYKDSLHMDDTSKINKLGWQANTDFEFFLKDTVKWYLDHLDWWDTEFIQSYLLPHPLAYTLKNADVSRSPSIVFT